MPSDLINLSTLFTNRIFRIPDYQRGYSWEEKQWEELWNDLNNLNNQAYHFTGIITLEKIGEDSLNLWLNEFDDDKETDIENNSLIIRLNNEVYKAYFIVDGQQRLITLMIIVSLLKNFLIETEGIQTKFISVRQAEIIKYIFGYSKDIPSYKHLIRDIFEDESMKIGDEPETIYTNNLKKTKEHFRKKIELLNQNQKQFLYKTISERLLFNVFEIPDVINTSMVFETLNYRGKKLSKLELFKNRLIFLIIKRHPTLVNEYRRKIIATWQDIYEWLGKNPESILKDDDFLRSFWIMFFQHDRDTDEAFQKFEEDIFNNKYKISSISKNIFLDPHCLMQLLDKLSQGIKFWFFIHNPFSDIDNFKNIRIDIRKMLEKLLRNGRGDFLKSLILAYFLRTQNQDEIFEVLLQIERHNYCVYLLAGKQADTNRPQLLREINRYFRLDKSHDFIIAKLIERTNSVVSFEQIQNNIHYSKAKNQKFYDWNGLKYSLWEYEEDLQKNNKAILNDYSSSKLSLVFPYEKNNWWNLDYPSIITRGRDEDSIEKLSYSLGNITITKNIKHSNNFNKLKINLQNGSYSDKEIDENYREWTDKSILERGKKILKFIENRWQISIGKNDDEKRRLLIGLVRVSE